jgi:acetyl-CoA acetyltransferase
MGSHGIRDRVAIIGMGCTAFGEHWDKSADDMLVESATAATAAAGIGLDDIDAFWVGTMGSGDDGKGDTTAPGNFSLLATAYAEKYGVHPDELKDVLTRIAWKNHQNGAKNPRAQFRKEVPKETIKNSPLVAGMLGSFDFGGGPGECVSFVSVVGTELGTQRSA